MRSAAVAVLATLSIASRAFARAPANPAIQIDNFAKVNDGYYRGAQPVDYPDLAALGVHDDDTQKSAVAVTTGNQ